MLSCAILLPTLNKNSVPHACPVGGLLQPLQANLVHGSDLPANSIMFKTKEPAFDPLASCYRLNFHGRVTQPSIKNFQLIRNVRTQPTNVSLHLTKNGQIPTDVDNDEVVCQFGRIDQDRFHLDFRRPFNALQAFCVALDMLTH